MAALAPFDAAAAVLFGLTALVDFARAATVGGQFWLAVGVVEGAAAALLWLAGRMAS